MWAHVLCCSHDYVMHNYENTKILGLSDLFPPSHTFNSSLNVFQIYLPLSITSHAECASPFLPSFVPPSTRLIFLTHIHVNRWTTENTSATVIDQGNGRNRQLREHSDGQGVTQKKTSSFQISYRNTNRFELEPARIELAD